MEQTPSWLAELHTNAADAFEVLLRRRKPDRQKSGFITVHTRSITESDLKIKKSQTQKFKEPQHQHRLNPTPKWMEKWRNLFFSPPSSGSTETTVTKHFTEK